MQHQVVLLRELSHHNIFRLPNIRWVADYNFYIFGKNHNRYCMHYSKLSFLKQLGAVLFFSSILLTGNLGPQAAHAQLYTGSSPDLGIEYPQTAGFNRTDIRITIARIIRVAMGLLGLILLLIVLYGGFLWMTAGGNEDKVAEAKKWISSGVIGLAIILSAYAITSFVIRQLVVATTSPEAAPFSPPSP